jgi:hypothetical protein
MSIIMVNKKGIYSDSLKKELVNYLNSLNGKPASLRDIFYYFIDVITLPQLASLLMEMSEEGLINRYHNGENTIYTTPVTNNIR